MTLSVLVGTHEIFVNLKIGTAHGLTIRAASKSRTRVRISVTWVTFG